VGLLGQVVVEDLPPARPAGEVEVDGAVEAPGAQQGGVEVGRPVGGPDDQTVGGRRDPLAELAPGGEQAVDDLDSPVAQADTGRRRVEGLELDEEFF
jgi:hypothetical protein